jgi:putative Mg2+ transporter-C (MgtC) family protein
MIIEPENPGRIAANILTGIGFLGAGLILKEGSKVINLTTAASIWFAARIGIAFGLEYHLIGVISTIAAIIIPRIPHINKMSPENIFNKKSAD